MVMPIKERPSPPSDDVRVLPPGVDVKAFIAQLGEQDINSATPGIIVLEPGKPARFIPTEPVLPAA